MTTVRAVVFPDAVGRTPSQTVSAIEGQTRQPEEMMIAFHAAGFEDAVRAALDGGTEWLWLVDGSVVPEPPALEALLEAVGQVELLPVPVLLASKIVDSDGSPDKRSLPVPDSSNPDVQFDAFHRRLLAVRLARRGSLLVHRRGFERCGMPNLGFVFFGDDLVWTARLLKSEPGLFVPQSVVVCRPLGEPASSRQRRSSVASGLRLLLSNGLELEEKPWFGGRLVEEILTLARQG